MLRTFDIPISWGELIKRTVREFSADNCLGLAAQLAYYFLLALVPAIVFLIALTSFFPAHVLQDAMARVATVAPGEMTNLLAGLLETIANGQNSGLLTFGFLMALWSSSAAIVAVTDALNRAYDIEEGRPWWKVRLTAIFLTLVLAVFVLVAFALILVGPTAAEWLARTTGLGAPFEWAWKILQWPIALALVVVAIAVVNYFAPDADQDWEWVTPGAVVATVLWLAASLAFKFYVGNFANYNETYGSLGGIIVLMLWFYISGIAILAGAEMNAEIEHASPHGKDAGEKVPGEKKKLGARAARAFEAKPKPPAPRPAVAARPQAFEPQPAGVSWFGRVLTVPVLLVRWWSTHKTRE
jgi:membrane protein